MAALAERTRPRTETPTDRQLALRDRFGAVGLAISGQQGPIPSEFAKFAHQLSLRIVDPQTLTGEHISNAFDFALSTIQPTPFAPVNFGRVAEIRKHFGAYASEITTDPVTFSEAVVHQAESVARRNKFLSAIGGPPFDF